MLEQFSIYDFLQMPCSKGVGYLSAPYSSGGKEEVTASLRSLRHTLTRSAVGCLYSNGLTIVNPVVFTHDFAVNYELPKDHKYWITLNDMLLRSCTYLLVYKLKGWNSSEGVIYERNFFQLHSRPIFALERIYDSHREKPQFSRLDPCVYQPRRTDE